MNCLFGHTGFVGGNIQLFKKFDYFYNSKNYKEAQNKEFNEIYFAGMPAKKWYANKFPEEDNLILENIINVLKTVKCNKFILFSTIDVYPSICDNFNESYFKDVNENYENHTYGLNRLKLEQFVKSNFNTYFIIRLPALYGYGLKKNIIYDLINNNQIENIPINSKFQWYDLNWLQDDLDLIIKNNIKEINLFTEPLETKEIIKLFDYSIDIFKNNTSINYDLKTNYSDLFHSTVLNYVRNKQKVLKNLKKFIEFEKIKKNKLCVSNICSGNMNQTQFFNILKTLGIFNIEIAPTLINTWDNINKHNFDFIKNLGLKIVSFQSLTYGLKYNIFNNEESKLLFLHLSKVIKLAEELKIPNLVFGSPKNRLQLNTNFEENKNIFINFFKKLSKLCKNTNISLEHNSEKYGCNFITKYCELDNIVKDINEASIKKMFDLGNAIMENTNLNNINLNNINHIHISKPDMKLFFEDDNDKLIKLLLLKNNYTNIISLEMLNKENKSIKCLVNSIKLFIQTYGN